MRAKIRQTKILSARIYQTRAKTLLDKMNTKKEQESATSAAAAQPAEENVSELSALIKLLTMKMAKEESREQPNISPECFSKIISEFDGDSISVSIWFDNFEKNADAYELSTKQRFVQARNKMVGAAKLFLEAVTVTDYDMLKNVLVEEFQKTFSSAEVHKKLSTRKKSDNESFHEYTLIMRKIASAGKSRRQISNSLYC